MIQRVFSKRNLSGCRCPRSGRRRRLCLSTGQVCVCKKTRTITLKHHGPNFQRVSSYRVHCNFYESLINSGWRNNLQGVSSHRAQCNQTIPLHGRSNLKTSLNKKKREFCGRHHHTLIVPLNYRPVFCVLVEVSSAYIKCFWKRHKQLKGSEWS